MLFGNIPGATTHKIVLLGLNAEITGNVEKAQISARGKYLATVFFLSLNRCQYGEMILSLKNDYVKQQSNHPRTLTNM